MWPIKLMATLFTMLRGAFKRDQATVEELLVLYQTAPVPTHVAIIMPTSIQRSIHSSFKRPIQPNTGFYSNPFAWILTMVVFIFLCISLTEVVMVIKAIKNQL